MNLVKEILGQLSGGAVDQLGSLLGTNAETTQRAASAAVPSLLSALAGLASSDDGTRKLTNALSGFDASSLGNIAQMLGGNASSVQSKGTSLLGSLFGDSMTSGLATMLGRITGLNSGIVKTLLAYLMPLVLGKVASQWRNQGGNAQALKSMFAEQRDNIEGALPTGFSLADIPDASEVRKPTYASTHTREREVAAAASPARWIVPLALALLGGFFLWQFLNRERGDQPVAQNSPGTGKEVTVMRPTVPNGVDVPDLARVREDVGGLFKSLDTTFADIKDAASAERAMPALKDLNAKIDAMNQVYSRLPAATQETLRPMLEEQVRLATEKANAVSSIDGIGAQFKALIQEIVAKITKWISGGSR